jgi:hypothetical protein
MGRLTDEERKAAAGRIAGVWITILGGPSTDFVLGRLWQDIESRTYKSLGHDTQNWEREKAQNFSEKNCSIIR